MDKIQITKIKNNDQVQCIPKGKWYRCTYATPAITGLSSMSLGAGMYFAELTTPSCSLVTIYVSSEGFVVTTTRGQRVVPTILVRRFTSLQIRMPRGATHVLVAADVMKELATT